MEKYRESSFSFSDDPETRYATNVLFQQDYWHSETISEGEVFYSRPSKMLVVNL